jgi:DNA-binding HxlR family transcriptional regulator
MFRTVFDDAMRQLAVTITNGTTWRVLAVLPEHLSYEVFRRLDQRQLGAKLGMRDNSVSRALKELHEAGVVERRGAGPVTEWRLTPDYGWRGDVASYHRTQRQRMAEKNKTRAGGSQKSDKIYYGKN